MQARGVRREAWRQEAGLPSSKDREGGFPDPGHLQAVSEASLAARRLAQDWRRARPSDGIRGTRLYSGMGGLKVGTSRSLNFPLQAGRDVLRLILHCLSRSRCPMLGGVRRSWSANRLLYAARLRFEWRADSETTIPDWPC